MHYAMRQIFAFAARIACMCLCLYLCICAALPAPAAAEGLFQNHGGSFSQTRSFQPRTFQSGGEAAPRRSFWDRLFHKSRPAEPNYAPPPSPRRAAAAPAAPKITPKNPDARRILVIGDFTAAALADALSRNYTDNPDILVRSKTDANSGLSKTAPYNWLTRLSGAAAEAKPDLIIVMLGANDGYVFSKDDSSDNAADALSAPSPANDYQAQVSAFIQALQKSGAAWLWVGLPPFQNERLNSAAAALNSMDRRAVNQAGGHFIDVWEGFTDDKGLFALSGYDVNGQLARLRTNDGIGFTLAGRRKLAFYAAQAVDLLWGNSAADGAPYGSSRMKGQTGDKTAPVNPLDIGVLSDGSAPELAGAAFSPHPIFPPAPASPASAPLGRADNFTLIPKQ